jgi:VWFA-related protein
MPAAPLKRADVRRTVVLFVDDLSMSSESVPAVRNGLRKFIEKQLQPGDLAAIVRASAGLGALQDFTTDRNLLLAAAGQVRWNPSGRGGAQAYRPVGMNPSDDAQLATGSGQAETISRINDYTVSVASSLWRLVHGMAGLPGRKSVVILSDNLPIGTPDETNPFKMEGAGSGRGGLILASMRRVVDESVRAGVVLYAIDTRGLNSLRAQAADRPLPPWAPEFASPGPGSPNAGPEQSNSDWVSDVMQGRRDEYSEGQWGALFLASQTGGFMVTEANFIDAGIQQVMNDQSGYYLLAFTPPPEALVPGRDGKSVYHRLKVQVQRSGVRVRSHQGFFGVADEDLAAASSRPELQLAAALESPFQSADLGVEIQSGFLNARKNDSFIRTAVVLDGRDLTLTGPPIHRTGVIHLLVRAFGVSGSRLEGGIDQTLRIDLNEEGYERALKYGLIYTALLPVAKPGPYQVRAACRDESTGRIGTASDFIVVPQLKGLALSGVVFLRSVGVEDHVRPATGPGDYAPGERAEFTLQIINPPDSRLTIRTHLFHDGAQVYESEAKPIETSASKATPFFTRSAIDIPSSLDPGDYLMRVDVGDQLPSPHQAKAWQWARLSVSGPRP